MLKLSGKILADGTYAKSVLNGQITSVCGIDSLQMGVFAGVIVGLVTAALHNRFYKQQLPAALAFFSGVRFVPIISVIAHIGVGIICFFVWPTIQSGIFALGNLVMHSGYFGTAIFGFLERALIPFGLHHVFYLPFWQTSLGGTMEVAGKMVEGAQNIFFAQLSDPTLGQIGESGAKEITFEARKKIYDQYQEELFKQMPMAFLYHTNDLFAYNEKLENVREGAIDYNINKNVWEWKVNK